MSKNSEGVIKFQLEFTPTAPQPLAELDQLNAWRQIMAMLKLIGQVPDRYGGYGFGNLSRRLPPFEAPATQRRFVITGSQTGGLAELTAQHYATVLECHPEQNRLVAAGPIRPSSESLTHGTIYALDDTVRWVFHAHSPHIWQQRQALQLPATHANVPYGTVEMATEVRRLFAETTVEAQKIFAMAGHEDGIVSFGATAREAGGVLINALASALAFS